MAKRKAAPRPSLLTADGLTQVVLDRLNGQDSPTAAELDLARKIITTRKKAGEDCRLVEDLTAILSAKLQARLEAGDAPTSVLDVVRKLNGILRPNSPEAAIETRDRAIQKGLVERGINPPFPIHPDGKPWTDPAPSSTSPA